MLTPALCASLATLRGGSQPPPYPHPGSRLPLLLPPLPSPSRFLCLRRQNGFSAALNALDFTSTRSAKDAELLYEVGRERGHREVKEVTAKVHKLQTR